MDEPTVLTPDLNRELVREIARDEVRRAIAEVPTRAQMREMIDDEIRRAVTGPVENVLAVMRSVDLHLRQVEEALQANTQLVSEMRGRFAGVEGIQTRHENQIESLAKRMMRVEQESAVIVTKQAELRADIYGDTTVRSDNPSLFERMDELKVMLANFQKDYDLRLQLVESYVKKQQAREQFVVNAVKRAWGLVGAGLHDWRVLLVALGMGAAVAAALLAGQNPQNPTNIFDLLR